LFDVRTVGLDVPAAQALARRAGVLISRTSDPGMARAVLHLDIDDSGVEQAAAGLTRAFASAG
jgi:hypothetical protein